MTAPRRASEWQVERWFNTPERIALAELSGRVMFAVAFQMLCPGCVSHGLPQAVRVRQLVLRPAAHPRHCR
jgi:hypothetical protein